MTGHHRTVHATRRQFLTAAGTVALTSGCLGGDGSDRRELGPKPLQSIPSKPAPDVPRRLPMAIGTDHLEESTQRARDLLSALPDAIGPGEISNGAIREEVLKARDSATEALQRADSAPTAFERLRTLRDARESAATANAAWLAIRKSRSREDALSDRSDLTRRLESFQDEWEYVGEEPIPAVLVSRALERLSHRASGHLERAARARYAEPDSPPGIGRAAGTLEFARCAIADAEHVYDRHTASEENRSLAATIESTARRLAERVDERASSLPAERPEDPSALVDRKLGATTTGRVLSRAFAAADRRVDEVEERRSAGEHATAILEAHEVLIAIETYEDLKERIAAGEDFPIDTAEDVVDYRREAVEAVRTTLEAGPPLGLDRIGAGQLGRVIRYTDSRFESIDADSTPRVRGVERETARYVRVATAARQVPEVSKTVASALAEPDA